MNTKIFIDTNYFLRYLVGDNKVQFEQVKLLLEDGLAGKAELFTNTVVIFEIYWVLSSFYKEQKQRCIELIDKILQLEFVDLVDREILLEAVEIFSQTGLEYEDCYHIAYSAQHSAKSIATFDQKMLREFKQRV